MMKNLVAIIAYSPCPSVFELASLAQCFRILGGHEICIVCPDSLDISTYKSVYSQYGYSPRVERFADVFFSSVESYSKLVSSLVFYGRFLDAEYLLLYQLDAWVFFDALEEWCAKDYDYIGAPWLTDSGVLLPFAGNGGFSLRKVKSFYDVLATSFTMKWQHPLLTSPIPFIFPTCVKKTGLPGRKDDFIAFTKMLRCKFFPKLHFKYCEDNEDVAFVQAFSILEGYHIAPPEVAMYFSFERFPRKLYEMTHALPFGAHALSRYAPDFWSEWVPVLSPSGANSRSRE